MRSLVFILLLTNIYAYSALDLVGKEVRIEDYHFRLGTDVSNLECGMSLTCVSNILSQKGGYFCDTNILLLKWDFEFLLWTNFQFQNNMLTAYRNDVRVNVEVIK